ncbi:hypothetical protein FKM82_029891 [Ascaphus truei]
MCCWRGPGQNGSCGWRSNFQCQDGTSTALTSETMLESIEKGLWDWGVYLDYLYCSLNWLRFFCAISPIAATAQLCTMLWCFLCIYTVCLNCQQHRPYMTALELTFSYNHHKSFIVTNVTIKIILLTILYAHQLLRSFYCRIPYTLSTEHHII